MRHRRLFARVGIAVSAVGLLIGLTAPLAAGAAPSAAASCTGSTVITAFHFTVNGVSISSLHRGNVQAGDKLEAFFTIANGCQNVPVTLVSHTMPGPTFVPSKVTNQKIFDLATARFNSGDHTLGPINVPTCWFQVDFVYGGIHGSGYGVHDHTYSSGTGGTTACSTSTPPAMTICTSASAIGLTFSPVTSASSTTYKVAVTVNGQTTNDTVSVTNAPVTKNYAVPEDSIATILVQDTSGATLLNQTVTHDCARPTVSIVDQCAVTNGGAAITATNEGSQPKTFTVTKNGVVVDHINVTAFSTMTVVETETVGQTATWAVTGPEGVATAPLTITHSCSSVLPVVISSPPSPAQTPAAAAQILGQQVGPLPKTGSNTGLLLWLAFGLMLAGALITLVSRRASRLG